jgi:uncharacterized protein
LRGGTEEFAHLHVDSGRRGPYHARAMGDPLRDHCPQSELAENRQVIDFSEKISEFEGLAEIVENDLETLDPDTLPLGWRDSLVAGQLSFGFADAQGGVAALEGEVTTTIDAVCQRCLSAFRMPLKAELRLLFDADDSVLADDESYEIWELEEKKFRPLDLVEEALIMSMPLVAMHVDDENCHRADTPVADSNEKIRPFASLKSQMEDGN